MLVAVRVKVIVGVSVIVGVRVVVPVRVFVGTRVVVLVVVAVFVAVYVLVDAEVGVLVNTGVLVSVGPQLLPCGQVALGLGVAVPHGTPGWQTGVGVSEAQIPLGSAHGVTVDVAVAQNGGLQVGVGEIQFAVPHVGVGLLPPFGIATP